MTWQQKGLKKLAYILKKCNIWTDNNSTLRTYAFEWHSHDNPTKINVSNRKKRIYFSLTKSM